MDCNLTEAKKIIEQDDNGNDLTEENYRKVTTLLACEINELSTTLTGKVKTGT